MAEFVTRCVVASLVSVYPDETDRWINEKLSVWDIKRIILEFSAKYKQRIYLHFDELDQLFNVEPRVGNQQLESLERLYEFWTLIHGVIQDGNLVYCTGRTSYLYALGKHLYEDVVQRSPGISSGIQY